MPYNNDITGWKAVKRIDQTNDDMAVKSEFPIYFCMVIPQNSLDSDSKNLNSSIAALLNISSL